MVTGRCAYSPGVVNLTANHPGAELLLLLRMHNLLLLHAVLLLLLHHLWLLLLVCSDHLIHLMILLMLRWQGLIRILRSGRVLLLLLTDHVLWRGAAGGSRVRLHYLWLMVLSDEVACGWLRLLLQKFQSRCERELCNESCVF